MKTKEYRTAVDGIDIDVRVHHLNMPEILGTVIAMGLSVAMVRYDNGITMRQSISVLKAAY